MNKPQGQLNAENAGIKTPTSKEIRKITVAHGVHKVGDTIEVTRWGSYGCYDTNGNWVDFYYSESV